MVASKSAGARVSERAVRCCSSPQQRPVDQRLRRQPAGHARQHLAELTQRIPHPSGIGPYPLSHAGVALREQVVGVEHAASTRQVTRVLARSHGVPDLKIGVDLGQHPRDVSAQPSGPQGRLLEGGVRRQSVPGECGAQLFTGAGSLHEMQAVRGLRPRLPDFRSARRAPGRGPAVTQVVEEPADHHLFPEAPGLGLACGDQHGRSHLGVGHARAPRPDQASRALEDRTAGEQHRAGPDRHRASHTEQDQTEQPAARATRRPARTQPWP